MLVLPVSAMLKEKTFFVLCQFADVLGQTRFVSGGGILVDNAFIYSLVDQRNRRIEEFAARTLITCADSGAKFLDLRAQFAAVCTVDLVSFCVLTNSLNC